MSTVTQREKMREEADNASQSADLHMERALTSGSGQERDALLAIACELYALRLEIRAGAER